MKPRTKKTLEDILNIKTFDNLVIPRGTRLLTLEDMRTLEDTRTLEDIKTLDDMKTLQHRKTLEDS